MKFRNSGCEGPGYAKMDVEGDPRVAEYNGVGTRVGDHPGVIFTFEPERVGDFDIVLNYEQVGTLIDALIVWRQKNKVHMPAPSLTRMVEGATI